MATRRMLAALMLVSILGASVGNVVQGASAVQNYRRKLLSTTTTWGSHQPGDKCYPDSGILGLVKPLVVKVVVYLNAGVILCVDLHRVDLSLLKPGGLLSDLPISTCNNGCGGLSAGAAIELKLNIVLDLLLLEKIVEVKGILGVNGLLVYLEVLTNLGHKKTWGNPSAQGKLLDVKIVGNLLLDVCNVPDGCNRLDLVDA